MFLDHLGYMFVQAFLTHRTVYWMIYNIKYTYEGVYCVVNYCSWWFVEFAAEVFTSARK